MAQALQGFSPHAGERITSDKSISQCHKQCHFQIPERGGVVKVAGFAWQDFSNSCSFEIRKPTDVKAETMKFTVAYRTD